MTGAPRTVLVTGATGGLGPAVVRRFLDGGDSVFAVGRRPSALDELARGLGQPDRLRLVAADLSVAAEARRVCDQAAPTAVVHLAGGWAGGHPAVDAPDDELEGMIAANLTPTWFVARAAMRHLAGSGAGRLVFVASTGGLGAAAGAAAYGAAKAAVLSLTLSLAEEGRRHGVTCNAVAPGTIATSANKAAMPDADQTAWVSPDDVAQAIWFLASEESAGVTGSTLVLTRGG